MNFKEQPIVIFNPGIKSFEHYKEFELNRWAEEHSTRGNLGSHYSVLFTNMEMAIMPPPPVAEPLVFHMVSVMLKFICNKHKLIPFAITNILNAEVSKYPMEDPSERLTRDEAKKKYGLVEVIGGCFSTGSTVEAFYYEVQAFSSVNEAGRIEKRVALKEIPTMPGVRQRAEMDITFYRDLIREIQTGKQ